MPDTSPKPIDVAQWHRLVWSPGIRRILVVELVVAILVAYGLWTLRQQTLKGELRSLSALSAAMASQADSTLMVADTVLRATRSELNGGLLAPSGNATHALLRARAAALPQFRALRIVDAQGARLASSREDGAHGDSGRTRDFFVTARELSGSALAIGTPYVSRSDGKSSIGVAMDWRDPSDRFAGVVVLVAEPGFLDGDFGHIAPTPDARLAIYRKDQALVSDGPGDNADALVPKNMIAALWLDPTSSVSKRIALPGGPQRLIATQTLQHFPLMVVITRDASAALADWTGQAILISAFCASALLVTFALALRNAREQTLRRASQAELAAEKERAIRAFQAAREGYWEWDPVLRKSHLSPRMRELMGLARVEHSQPHSSPATADKINPDDMAPLRVAFEAHAAGKTPFFDFTFGVRHSDGLLHQVRTRGQVWRNAAGDNVLFTGTGADVTAEVEAQNQTRLLEDQLQQARKLEALGTLAGGIAHDFNNILAAVIGYGELAMDGATPQSSQARWIGQILRGGQRGKALVERILSYAQTNGRHHTAFRLQPVIEEMLDLLGASLRSEVDLVRDIQAPELVVSGDATMVYEAAMNLCTNAMQAMPEGGTLQVELVELVLPEPLTLLGKPLAPGRYARLSVVDTGVGFSQEVMAKLFEPFFTTKAPHQGTGLGLAVVHSVMADMGGAIDVHSAPGRGARFVLYFPCTDKAVDGAAFTPTDVAVGQGQTILVVDDDPTLVELAEELLAGLGFEAVGFSSSVQALAEFTAYPERFDLVLTDELMPDITGCALACAIHAQRPGLPIVLASGYGGPQLEPRALACGVSVVVKKPLIRHELAQVLTHVLCTGTPPRLG